MSTKAVFNWSGGKDSALALQQIMADETIEVVALFTTFNQETEKSSMHSIPLELLTAQAKSLGFPLYTMFFSKSLSDYDDKMHDVVRHFKEKEVTAFIFGDLMPSNLKSFRESKLNPLGIQVIEPLWNKTSHDIMSLFLQSGIKTKIIVTQEGRLDKSYIGKTLNQNVVNTFPPDIDVCGENGEYHTFAYDGPMFRHPVKFAITSVYDTLYEFKLDDGTHQHCIYWSASYDVANSE